MRLSTAIGALSTKIGYEEAIRCVAKAGFDAFDLTMCYIHQKPNKFKGDDYLTYVNELKQLAMELNIKCNQAHAPFPTQLNGNDEYNKRTFDAIIRSMECASILGADIIVMHPIKNSSSSIAKDCFYEPYVNDESLFNANVEFFKKLIPYCEKFNIKIAVENMWERHPQNREILIPSFLGNSEEHRDFIDIMQSKWIVGCLDIGHSLICGENPADAIFCLGKERLGAMHIHDCNSKEDSHTLPYSADADWDAIASALAKIGYDGDFTFEAENLFENLPNELLCDALTFMGKIGRHIINLIEKK